MNRRLFVLVGAIAATAFASATVAQAAVTTNESVPVTDLVPFVDVPCANGGVGETLALQGDIHVLLTTTINGNNISGKFHFQPGGVSGIGSITGDTYRATGVTQGHFTESLQNDHYSESFVNNFRMIGPGPGNNLLIHDVFHITINAGGDVTVEHEISRVECE